MAGFESRNVNPKLRDRLHGLDAVSIRIAEDPNKRQQLDDFIESRVRPDSLDFFVPGAGSHSYGYVRFSGLGVGGTLLHIRAHRQNNGRTVPPDLTTAVVIGSLEGGEPETWLDTTIHHRRTYQGTDETEIVLHDFEDDVSGMSEAEWQALELDELLDAEEVLAGRPSIHYNGQVWSYRQSSGLVEPLRDLMEVKRRVDLALERGFGQTALRASEINAGPELTLVTSGRIEEKVVA
ncbi:MAG TPA: hypothetical protein PK096_01830 [Candidatus Saccharibacteria bacterium]|nr:hypothetical protein [Candidatus Saccharibacteria bacterium]HRK94086.1 hypothetical protein [Candidatus Saccharibacteria bacterium]